MSFDFTTKTCLNKICFLVIFDLGYTITRNLSPSELKQTLLNSSLNDDSQGLVRYMVKAVIVVFTVAVGAITINKMFSVN